MFSFKNLSRSMQQAHCGAGRLGRAGLILAATVASSAALAVGDYSYWFYDEHQIHQPGDLSLGNQNLAPPAWACGRRFFSGALLQWVGDDEAVLQSTDYNTPINVHTRGAVGGCQAKPLVERHLNPPVEIVPPLGRHYVAIDPDAGSHWFDKNGKWPVCNCALPGSFTTLTGDVRWAALDLSFQRQLDRAEGRGGWIGAEPVHSMLYSLQLSVTTEISRRRLVGFGTIETAVRQLEDLALVSMDKASAQLQQCRQLQGGDAYKACATARRAAGLALTALRTIGDEVRP